MEKEKYEEPNLVVLNGSGSEFGIQPFGIVLVPIFLVAAVVVVAVAAAGVFAIEGATQVHAAVNVATVVSTS